MSALVDWLSTSIDWLARTLAVHVALSLARPVPPAALHDAFTTLLDAMLAAPLLREDPTKLAHCYALVPTSLAAGCDLAYTLVDKLAYGCLNAAYTGCLLVLAFVVAAVGAALLPFAVLASFLPLERLAVDHELATYVLAAAFALAPRPRHSLPLDPFYVLLWALVFV